MQGWTATTRHGVTRKEAQNRLQDTENLFRKKENLVKHQKLSLYHDHGCSSGPKITHTCYAIH